MLIIDPQDCPLFIAGDKTQLRELLHPSKQPLKLGYSLSHATVEPGVRSLSHRLRTSEVYYILSGQGEIHIDDESQAVAAGHTIYIPPGATQFIANTGTENLAFLCIVDPAWRAEDEEVVRGSG